MNHSENALELPAALSPPAPTWGQTFWRRFCQTMTSIFYRRFEVAGLEHLPRRGPVVLCANHVNALVDALVVQAACPRPIHPIARSGLFRNPLLRPILKVIQAVPIYRRHQSGPSSDHDVAAKNAASFARLYDHLAEGRLLLIFPEGQSHSDPMLRPLKTGAARLALGLAERGGGRPAVVPVGLVFPEKGRFRSDVLVQYGAPIRFEETAGETSEQAVRRYTEEIETGLEQVTLNLDSWQDLRLLSLFQSFFERRGGQRRDTLATRFQSLQRLAEAYRFLRFTRPDEVTVLTAQLERFERLCQRYGVQDYHLHLHYTPAVVSRFVLRSLGFALFVFPLALWGMLNSALPYFTTRWLSRRTARGRDQYDSAGMLFGIPLFLGLWSAQSYAVLRGWGLETAVTYAASLPATAVIALLVSRERRRILDNVRVFVLFARRRKLQDYLRLKRQELEVALARTARIARQALDEGDSA